MDIYGYDWYDIIFITVDIFCLRAWIRFAEPRVVQLRKPMSKLLRSSPILNFWSLELSSNRRESSASGFRYSPRTRTSFPNMKTLLRPEMVGATMFHAHSSEVMLEHLDHAMIMWGAQCCRCCRMVLRWLTTAIKIRKQVSYGFIMFYHCHTQCPVVIILVGAQFCCCTGQKGQSNLWRTSRYSNPFLRPSVEGLDMVWVQTKQFPQAWFQNAGTLSWNMASKQWQKGNLEMHHTLHTGLHHLSTIKTLHGEATLEELEKAIVDSRPVPEWSWKWNHKAEYHRVSSYDRFLGMMF